MINAGVIFAILCAAVSLGTLPAVHSGRTIILNEDALLGTCTGTCEGMPELFDKEGCTKISGCRRNSNGWTRGFVRCDHCACQCDESTNSVRDIDVVRKGLSSNEPDLYGTCTKTCDRTGLVRTNFDNCQRVENCRKARNGWTRGFVRCDYCTCDCVNSRESASYRLRNVKYSLNQANKKVGRPTTFAENILENASNEQQRITRVVSFDQTQTTTISSSHTMGYGLTITEASVGDPDIATVKASVAHKLTYGNTQTAGKSNTITKMEQIRAEVVVPARSSITAVVIGTRDNIEIPYSADLLITYKDGSTKTKRISGVFTNVDTANFRVQYSAATPYVNKN